MTIQNAIFDLDGTLIDSMKHWRTVQMRIIEEMYGILLPEELQNKLIRLNDHDLIGSINELYDVTIDKREVALRSEGAMEQNYHEALLAVKPFVKEYFDFLKRNGCGIGLSTATPHHLCEPYLKKVGLYDYFDCIFTSEDAGVSKRRSPAIYDLSLHALGGTKENTAVFEDVLACIETSKKAGYYTVAVADDLQESAGTIQTPKGNYETSSVEAIKATADRYIVSYKEMMEA